VAESAADLDGASTAEQAIAKDRAPAWKRLTELAGDYSTLRVAQRALMSGRTDLVTSSRSSNGGEDTASDLVLQNLDDLWPSWRNPGQTERVINVSGEPHRYEPWPAEPAQLLLWLVTSTAQPWVPTIPQLERLWDRRRNLANPNPRIAKGIRDAPINSPIQRRRPVYEITALEA
jgi:hypothetical protein